jgi:hypothetical protein
VARAVATSLAPHAVADALEEAAEADAAGAALPDESAPAATFGGLPATTLPSDSPSVEALEATYPSTATAGPALKPNRWSRTRAGGRGAAAVAVAGHAAAGAGAGADAGADVTAAATDDAFPEPRYSAGQTIWLSSYTGTVEGHVGYDPYGSPLYRVSYDESSVIEERPETALRPRATSDGRGARRARTAEGP